ncbi:unnamed protein product [Allacma fusca]|uniref:LYR motif-containing protein 5 n=1 Tax=Allacma fusca TaxID=39272 RepID=A0A8J2P8K4_9HEXA|nr:unnamed protein product [Allacma fusca]
MTTPELRSKVIQLYKTLLFLGRDYPKGYVYFRDRCHNAFAKNKDVKDPEQIRKLMSHGEFVVKEVEALYYLKKYRTLKKRYYKDEDEEGAMRRLESTIESKSEK